MSEIKVNSIKGVGASVAAITVNNTDGTATANITNNLSNRNKVINGGMIVKQRADLTMTTTSTYSLDRFRGTVGSSFNWSSATVTQSTTSPDGFGKSLKVDIASTNTPTGSQNAIIQTRIEGQDLQDLAYGTSSAKPCTLSFYVRSNKTGTYCVQIANTANTKYVLFEYTINSADTWERKSVTFSGNTANTLNNDNALGFDVNFHLATGSDDHVSATSTWTTYSGGSFRATSNQVNLFDNASNEWYLTGVQLEVGSVATDFEHRSFGQELALCQRYFFSVTGDNADYPGCYTGGMARGGHFFWMCHFPVAMRTNPTYTGVSGNGQAYGDGDSSVFANSTAILEGSSTTPNPRGQGMRKTSAGGSLANGNGYMYRFSGDGNVIHFDAEL